MPFILCISLYIKPRKFGCCCLSKGRPFTVRGDLDGRQILDAPSYVGRRKHEYAQAVCFTKSKPFKLTCPMRKGKFHLQKLSEIKLLRLRLNFYTGKGRMNWHKDDYNFARGPQFPFAEPHCWMVLETVLGF